MPTAPLLDLGALLAPVAGDNPAGEDLRYDPIYDQVREARRADDLSLDQGDWKRELKSADWDLVVELCTEALAGRTKDLQLATWLTEALVQLHGFAGLRDGLALLAGLQANFWDTYYPEVDDGDLESRHGPFTMLNEPVRGLPSLVRNVPLTRGLDDQEYSFAAYTQSRETDNLIRKNPGNEAKILATGRITSKNFDDAVAQTPKTFYAVRVDDLRAALAHFEAFEADTDQRFGRDAPSLLELRKAIDDVLRLLDPILAAKRQADPDPVAEPEPAPAGAEGEGEAGEEQGPAGAGTAPAGGNGAIAFDGVAVPRRRLRLGTPQEGEAPDFGRVLIDYHERVKSLAEAGAQLAENRRRYAELLAELKQLDDQYEELSQVVSKNREAYQLLARLLRLP